MNSGRRWMIGLLAAAASLTAAGGGTAWARICSPGMYCPTFKVTLRSFGSHLGGCNDGGGCGTFRVTNSLTMSGTGEERNCMRLVGEPCGNIVAIYPDGDTDWSVNTDWPGPPY